MKRRRISLLLALPFLLLCACSLPGGVDLLCPPKPPAEYNGLYELLGKTLATGAVYASPDRGENRQNIQFVDLDNDGNSEALVFFKLVEEPSLRIFVYAQNSEDVYTQVTGIAVMGDSIDSITYADLNYDSRPDVVVSYRLGNIKAISMYTYSETVMTEVYTAECSSHYIADMTGDGTASLLLLNFDPIQLGGLVRMLRYENGTLSEITSAPLSKGISALTRVTYGVLSDGYPALFVASSLADSTTANLTDLFVYKNQQLSNLTMDDTTGASIDTICMQSVYSTNIDSDPQGIVEIPQTVELPPYDPTIEGGTALYLAHWYDYRSDGKRTLVQKTYYTRQAGWYWVIPEHWTEDITVQMRESRPSERVTTFAFYHGPDVSPTVVLTFYTITLALDETVSLGSRILLYESASNIVAAEIAPSADIDEETLKRNFYLKPSEWTSGVLA